MVTDEQKRELQTNLRNRLRSFPCDKIAKAAKLPTVDVIRFMDGGEDLADGDLVTRLALATFALDAEKELGGEPNQTCVCPACTIRRLLQDPKSDGPVGLLMVKRIQAGPGAKLGDKDGDKTVTEGLDWDSMPKWFNPVCAATSLVLSVVAIAFAMIGYWP